MLRPKSMGQSHSVYNLLSCFIPKVPVLNHQRNYIIDEYLHNIDEDHIFMLLPQEKRRPQKDAFT